MSNISVAEILQLHRKWIQSKEFSKLVAEKLEVSERMAYRKIKEAVEKGEILKVTLQNRSVLYGLAEFGEPTSNRKELSFEFQKHYLLQKLWNELFEIFKADSLGSAYRQFRKLVLLMPDEIKEQIQPLIKNLDKRVILLSDEYLGLQYAHQRLMFRREFEAIIDKLASLLHSYTQKVGEKA
ncbi:MAG: hypothetical protein QXK18_04835 [Candidatus Bathyarchaeia archaeon]